MLKIFLYYTWNISVSKNEKNINPGLRWDESFLHIFQEQCYSNCHAPWIKGGGKLLQNSYNLGNSFSYAKNNVSVPENSLTSEGFHRHPGGNIELTCICSGGSEVGCWQKNGKMYMMKTTHTREVKDEETLVFEILYSLFHLFIFWQDLLLWLVLRLDPSQCFAQ